MNKSIKKVLLPMSPQKRIEYIWHYYKIHIMVGISVIILIMFSINSVVDKKEVALSITILGQKVDTAGVYDLEAYLNVKLLSEDKDTEINIQYVKYDHTSMDGEFGLQRVLADITAGFIDVLIVDKHLFKQFSDEQQLLPINSIKGYEKIDLEKNKPYYSGDQITGISTSEMNLLNSIDFDGEKVICIPANVNNVELFPELFGLLK